MSALSSSDQESSAAAETYYMFTATYAMASGLTVVVFDQVLNFGLEVDLVWRRRSSTREYFLKTVVYAMLRYVGLLWAISDFCLNMGVPSTGHNVRLPRKTSSDADLCEYVRCYQVYIVEEVSIYVLTFLLQGMMAIRVWALLGTQRKVLVFLLTTFIVSQAVSLADAVLFLAAYAGVSSRVDEHVARDCVQWGSLPSWSRWLIPWSAGMLAAFELILCLFAVFHVVKGARIHGSLRFRMGRVVSTLVRGNLVYFFLAFFILLITALEEIPWIQSGLYWITFSSLKYVFYGLVGPWMMLDLRKEAYGDPVESAPSNIQMSLFPRHHRAMSATASSQALIFHSDLSSVSGFTIVVFDLLLNIGEEIELIWSKNFTKMTILYAILRYGGAFWAITELLWTAHVPMTPMVCVSTRLSGR
ncbi:hypothetical protein CONPUDRAFT_158437 [Coniophora puteana RWD-64-598 SS2]|uniref:DUF6533 domain-containing protein n=1 Tax=Coniophora puteana (strain RWD-64-598) TaxID=741705 RepID=A0A5M3MBZ3_CONPW|nr:uncharacterized protein CONPUDRAFT_158437 [Coniophora puteana RWD-64-598 SS2]EIW76414.1 hypothetical protein CONPUDRAFT_158437 [Coniophora puteana RWD-64-598 SS2]